MFQEVDQCCSMQNQKQWLKRPRILLHHAFSFLSRGLKTHKDKERKKPKVGGVMFVTLFYTTQTQLERQIILCI